MWKEGEDWIMKDEDYPKYEKWLADLLKRTGNDGPVPEGKFRGVPSPHHWICKGRPEVSE